LKRFATPRVQRAATPDTDEEAGFETGTFFGVGVEDQPASVPLTGPTQFWAPGVVGEGRADLQFGIRSTSLGAGSLPAAVAGADAGWIGRVGHRVVLPSTEERCFVNQIATAVSTSKVGQPAPFHPNVEHLDVLVNPFVTMRSFPFLAFCPFQVRCNKRAK